MAKMSKFKRSQNAHLRLNATYLRKDNTAKNRAFGNYHIDCYERQKRAKRLLSRAERRKLFLWWCKYEGYATIAKRLPSGRG